LLFNKIELIVLLKSIFFLLSLNAFSLLSQRYPKNIDTNYVYDLPFAPGEKSMVMQGYNGSYSHQGQFALDFKAKKGTPVHAAREGIVYKTESSNVKGGPKKKFLRLGNHIVIKHSDGTFAAYWHLLYEGALVKVGDIIAKGQLIGLSGNTGYSSWAHLHFDVYYYSEGKQVTIPTLFKTSQGIKKLKVYRSYRKPIESQSAISKNIDKIEYHFQDASVPPLHHRSYTWIITETDLRFTVNSYGTILKDTTIAISAIKWEQCKTAFLNCGIKNQKNIETNQGCTGGTSITIQTWLNEKENFSGTASKCGGKTEGNLSGNAEKFLSIIKEGVDPLVYQTN
jgi:murein DD-endopeptidase MepM/ murein hydrolase activator NlpD